MVPVSFQSDSRLIPNCFQLPRCRSYYKIHSQIPLTNPRLLLVNCSLCLSLRVGFTPNLSGRGQLTLNVCTLSECVRIVRCQLTSPLFVSPFIFLNENCICCRESILFDQKAHTVHSPGFHLLCLCRWSTHLNVHTFIRCRDLFIVMLCQSVI